MDRLNHVFATGGDEFAVADEQRGQHDAVAADHGHDEVYGELAEDSHGGRHTDMVAADAGQENANQLARSREGFKKSRKRLSRTATLGRPEVGDGGRDR